MKITFSVFPPRAALRNEAESSDCKMKQIRNGLSTILFSSYHVIISTRDFILHLCLFILYLLATTITLSLLSHSWLQL